MVKPLPGIAERYLTWPASEDDNTCSSTVVSDSGGCPWAWPDVLHLRPKLSVPHPSVAEQVVGIRVSLCASVEQHALALVRHAMTPTPSGACVRSGSPLPAVPLPRVAQWGVYEFDLTAASKTSSRARGLRHRPLRGRAAPRGRHPPSGSSPFHPTPTCRRTHALTVGSSRQTGLSPCGWRQTPSHGCNVLEAQYQRPESKRHHPIPTYRASAPNAHPGPRTARCASVQRRMPSHPRRVMAVPSRRPGSKVRHPIPTCRATECLKL